MNLGKYFLGLFIFCRLVLADGDAFHVSSIQLPPVIEKPGEAAVENADLESILISRLKVLAVTQWLQSRLGERSGLFEKGINADFVEKFILDYKVNRTNVAPGTMELVGHLDSDSLKKWIRSLEAKSNGGNSLRSVLILSSNIPGLNFSPSNTASKIQDSSVGQLIYQTGQSCFQKLNGRLTPLEMSLNLEAPPKNAMELQILSNAANRLGASFVVWAVLSTCPGCPQPRLDLFLYQTQLQTLSLVLGEDLLVGVSDLDKTEMVKKSVVPLFQQLQTEMENGSSEGAISESRFKVILDNIESYRLLKAVESEWSQGSGFSHLSLKRMKGKAAEYEIRSSLEFAELTQRFRSFPLTGYQLQVSPVDSSTLLVRYVK